ASQAPGLAARRGSSRSRLLASAADAPPASPPPPARAGGGARGGGATAPRQARAPLREVVALSPADETAITWIETRQAFAGTRSGGPASGKTAPPAPSIPGRVIEAGRPGVYPPPTTA